MIGGSTELILQANGEGHTNSIGEAITNKKQVATLLGWIDLLTQDTKRTTYDAKIQESTHVFICDYEKIDVDAENCTAVVEGKLYDVMLVDDPMEKHEQLEIYLKYTGGQ